MAKGRGAAAIAAAAGLVLFAHAAAAQAPTRTYAQELVARTLATHPELNALTMHVTPAGENVNVVIASNLPIMGKAADKDDLAVANDGKIIQEPNKTGTRYSVELPLLDSAGDRIGALAVGFTYKAGEDISAFVAKATAIRDALGVQIADLKELTRSATEVLVGHPQGSYTLTDEKSALGVSITETPLSVDNLNSNFQRATGTENIQDNYKYSGGLNIAGPTGYDLNFRGFTTTVSDRGAVLTDGLPGATVRFGSPPAVGVERTEVIKGPASVLFGAGQPGGFVNVVTKKPEDRFHGDVGFITLFSGPPNDHFARNGIEAYGDITGALTDDHSLLGRAIAQVNDRRTWRDFAFDHQYFETVSALYRLDAKTTFFAKIENRGADSDDSTGVVAPKNNINLVTPRIQTSYQQPGDYIHEGGIATVLGFNHEFGAGVNLTIDARDVQHVDKSSGFENNHVFGDEVTEGRLLNVKENTRRYDFANSNLQVPFSTFGVGHNVVFGLSVGRDYLLTQRFQNLQGDNATLSSLNISIYDPFGGQYNYGTALDPTRYPLCGAGKPGTVNGNACNKNLITQSTSSATTGIRLSDMLNFGEHFKLLLAGRYDQDLQDFIQRANFPIAGTNPPQTTAKYNINTFLPMASFIYEPVPNRVSFYATYSTGFVPAAASNNDIHGHPLTEPATARSEEIGAKAQLMDGGLNLTGALFNIQKEKTPLALACAPDAPAGAVCFSPSTTHSKGVEVQADARITPEWHIIGGYSYIDARVRAAPDPLTVGAQATNTPENTFRVWSRYDFKSGVLKDFGFGIGENWVDTRAGTLPTTPNACSATNGDACYSNIILRLPSYATTDLTVYYKTEAVNWTLRVGNLFNERYFQAANVGTNQKIVPGEPMNITLTARIPF